MALLKAAGNEDDNSDMLLLLLALLYETCAEECQLAELKAITVVVGEGNKGGMGGKRVKSDKGEDVNVKKKTHTQTHAQHELERQISVSVAVKCVNGRG